MQQTYTAHPTHDHTRARNVTLRGFNLLNAKPPVWTNLSRAITKQRAFVKLTRIIMCVQVGLILQPWRSDFQRRLLHV